MGAVVSCSRRTDIPALYGRWFNERISAGFCECINPFNHTRTRVSLALSDVLCFVFWSKNYIPFTETLRMLHEKGYHYYLNYTINGYPEQLEPLGTTREERADNLIALSEKATIFWRYDPLYISAATDMEFHRANFTKLCLQFAGHADRIILNLLQPYSTVMCRLSQLPPRYRPVIPADAELTDLIRELREIAAHNQLTLYSCTPALTELPSMLLPQSHCVDRETIERITGKQAAIPITPTYKGCGCYKSTDIGTYTTCGNACAYCYANKSYKTESIPLSALSGMPILKR